MLDGKAATSHTHSASDLTAAGTRNATTYLRGDNTWAAPTGDVQFSIQGTQSPVVLPANQFVTYPLEWIDYNIGGGVWDPATYTYRVPKNGLYLCLGGIRMEDGHASRSVATGIATTNADAGFVLWDGMGGQPSGRSGRQYMRITRFNAGDAVRLFIYSDTSFSTKSQRQGSFLSLTKIAD